LENGQKLCDNGRLYGLKKEANGSYAGNVCKSSMKKEQTLNLLFLWNAAAVIRFTDNSPICMF
jgi:hypothetical protein